MAQANPFDQFAAMPAAAPPYPYGAPPAPPQQLPFGAPPPAGQPYPMSVGVPPPQYGAPYGAPPAPPQYAPLQADPFAGFGAPAPPPSMPPPQDNPFGSGGGIPFAVGQTGPFSQPPVQAPAQYEVYPPPQDTYSLQGAIVPIENQSNPYAQNQVAYSSALGAPPPPGAYPLPQQQQQLVPATSASMDPFSVFEAQQPPITQPSPPVPTGGEMVVASPVAAADDDFWGAFSASAPAPAVAPDAGSGVAVPAPAPASGHAKTGAHAEDLPPGGEWYDARIFTPTLGVMFFKPQELTDSLFLNTDKSLVDGLSERPVVAFIVEGSSARSAGVELGHVLLKVNGVDVKNPKEASRLIKEGPRPLPLLFYVPNTEVVIAEGEHMVKYDTRETTAPGSAKDWKPKYCVVGGIIAQPWMLNMYRSKSEYDIAVIETQARRPVSVKVKQFSLQGARIQNDWQGPQMVKYKNKLHPWKYIVVLPVARNPIKISSPNLASLKPVHEGIRRVLLAQQRDRGSKPVRPQDNNNSAAQQQQPPPQSSSYGAEQNQQAYRY